MSNYPTSLKEALLVYGVAPTWNVEWDKGVLVLMKANKKEEADACVALSKVVTKAVTDIERARVHYQDLSNPAVYAAHSRYVIWIANNIVLAPQRRKFDIDDNNREVLQFLLYYFNDCPLAENVFPDRNYKLHKNLLLNGAAGVGKTMLMQIFSEYLKRTNNPRHFHNVSVTQMVNFHSIHNNIDKYTYNEKESKGFQGNPVNLCLNDIGVENRPFYGIDTNTVVSDFLHARNEIWTNFSEYDRKFAHLTTNLSVEQLKKEFSQKDSFGRIIDRFKTYNVIPIEGKSRR